jgi:hypothetical protein
MRKMMTIPQFDKFWLMGTLFSQPTNPPSAKRRGGLVTLGRNGAPAGHDKTARGRNGNVSRPLAPSPLAHSPIRPLAERPTNPPNHVIV